MAAPDPIYPGFDPKWRDVPDYILGITREIWEQRHIDRLAEYYDQDLIVRSPASIVQGNTGIIAATQSTLAEFPDRELPGEDVIWCNTGDGGFLSSHRLICHATHAQSGVYGAPTGRRLSYRILADCWCAENKVKDEWLVRDQGAIVRQLGRDPQDWTRELIAREGGPDACVRPFAPERDIAGPYRGRGNDDANSERLIDALCSVMQGAFSTIPDRWDRACHLHYPGHVEAHGHAEADRFWLGLRSAFPSAQFTVHHHIGREDVGFPPRASVRWALDGGHDGAGMFGPPSGAQVHVMGITHAEFGPWGLRREWTLIDETAIWKQILLQSGGL